MRNLRQSRMLKAVAVMLLFFSIVSVPLSIVGEIYLYRRVFGSSRTEMFGGTFEKSQIFSDLFSKRIGQLAEYIKLKNILETDGKLDYDRVVNKTDYTVGSLIRRNHFFVEDIHTQADVLLEELFTENYQHTQSFVYWNEYGEAEIGYAHGEAFIREFDKEDDWLPVDKEDDALELFRTELSEPEAERAEVFVEDTEIKGGARSVSVQEEAEEALLPQGSMRVFTIDDLSYHYTYYAAYYLYYQKLFAESPEQSFLYTVSNGTDTYTNLNNIEPYRSGKAEADGTLRYNSSEYTVDTDVENIRRSYVDNLEKALSDGTGEVSIFAAVVTEGRELSETDMFVTEKNRYFDAQSMWALLMVCLIAGVFGIIVAGFYLLASAGHAKDVEGVRLTGFDKWYTEIAGLLCGVVLICCVLETMLLIDEALNGNYIDGTLIASLVVIGIMTVVSYLVGIFSMASLVRRIKACTLWKNSFFRSAIFWMIRSVKRMIQTFQKMAEVSRVIYEERDITARVIIAYVMVLAATVITGVLIMISIWSGSVLALFFLLLFAGIHAGTLYMLLREKIDYKRIIEGIERMADGDLNYKIDEMGLQTDNMRLAVASNRIGDGLAEAVEKSIKDERMKTDLITNVSHDIKTPLTSIINYVDLLKRERIEDEKIRSYIDVLDSKSQRLKNLTDDLVEASKLSSGNIVLSMQEINLVELVNQANGEFSEKFELKNLAIVPTLPENPVMIEADGRRIWRVLENLYNNVAKYAMENTRVYVSVVSVLDRASFIIKNISDSPLNINAEELTERFIRGDISRSTEGSGLGLSIAKSLTELMKGSFEIYLDGDLFRATVTFPLR